MTTRRVAYVWVRRPGPPVRPAGSLTRGSRLSAC